MIARIVPFVVFVVACGPKEAQPPPPPPPAGDAQPLEQGPAAFDAGAAPTDDTPAPPARVWLKPTEVSWPTDRIKAQFHGLGAEGIATSGATAVSGDGSTPAGWAVVTGGKREAVRWRNGVMEPLALPDAAADGEAVAMALSFDGRVVGGHAAASSPIVATAIVWREGEAPHPLPWPEGTRAGQLFGLSKDGTIAIGCRSTSREAGCDVPLRWTGDHVAEIAGPRPFDVALHPVTTSGKIVVGTADNRAVRLDGTSTIRKDPPSRAASITDDGKIIVGELGDDAVLWHGRAVKVLGKLPGHSRCAARAVSADGGRVVGNCTRTGGSTAWIWDARHGMRSVADALAAARVKTIGWSLDQVTDICSYGVTLVGRGSSPTSDTEAWMALVPR